MPNDASVFARHEARTEKLEIRIHALEGKMILAEALMERIGNDLYNHGKDGLLTRFNTFFTQHKEREDLLEKQQERRHQENSQKLEELNSKIGEKALEAGQRSLAWTIAGVCVAIAALMAAVFFGAAALKLPHSNLDPAHIFHSKVFNPMLSFMRNPPQEAGSSIAHHY